MDSWLRSLAVCKDNWFYFFDFCILPALMKTIAVDNPICEDCCIMDVLGESKVNAWIHDWEV